METARLKDNLAGISAAAEILKADGIVAVPTETVYGLAASAYSDTAISKVFAAKGRPQDNPLIVHISDFEMLSDVVSDFPKEARALAERFWPGPLTMVLPKGEKVADSVSRGLSTVAVRMPNNRVALDIIKAAGIPLAAPSANLSGSPSPTTADHVISDLDGKIDAVVMSGSCEVGLESTVVSLSTDPPRLLRPGFVTAEELKEILPNLVVDKAVLEELQKGEKAASPGMMYKHYSPKTEVFLVEAEAEEFISFVNSKENCAAICFSEEQGSITAPTLSLGAKDNNKNQAQNLFSLLRECDSLGVQTVFVHAPKKDGVGLAVYNRLIRAAGFKVIKL
ncbi:MAG: threonylcarbamoyl-AMP synthase [Clostridia bacterium]|nr:threonylcarbamoyl-AMP synthase [Clostridia bacterium]